MIDDAFRHNIDSAVVAKHLHIGTNRLSSAAGATIVISQRTRGRRIYPTLEVKSKEAEVAICLGWPALCSDDALRDKRQGGNLPTRYHLESYTGGTSPTSHQICHSPCVDMVHSGKQHAFRRRQCLFCVMIHALSCMNRASISLNGETFIMPVTVEYLIT